MSAQLSRRPRALPALIALATALVLAMLTLPTAAHAHDTLISTDPEEGATLETSPEEITLTYSANILDVSPVVQISDEDGETLADITPRIEGPDAIAELPEPLPAGTHTVQWRVVSSDGHPIEGTFELTVEQGEDAPADEDQAAPDEDAPADEAEAAPAEDGDQEGDTAEAAAADETDEAAGSTMPLLLVVIGVAVLGVVIAAVFALRRRS